MSGHVAHAQITIDAPRERTWSALTDPALVKEWMVGTNLTTTWEVGSPITWQGSYEGRDYEDKGEVLEFAPPRRLSVTHYSPLMGQEDRPENYHTLTYDLASDTDGGPTTVTLDQDGNDSQEQAEQFSQTWQSMLEALKSTVERSG